MLNSMGLGLVFSATDLASGTINKLEMNFMSLDRRVGLGAQSIESAFHQMGLAVGLFTAGAIAVGGGFALAESAGAFESAIASVAAVSGATGDALAGLHDAAIQAGLDTQFAPTEAAVGLRELAAAGFSAQEAITLLKPALDLAGGSLGELSPSASAGVAAQAIKAFGIEISQASKTVDQLLQSVNLFALSAADLPMALGNSSRGAQALGQSLQETLIAVGLVKNIVPGIEKASTAVSIAMERMVDPKVQQALRGIGAEVSDAQGKFLPFFDIVEAMTPALSKMTDVKRSDFLRNTFGNEALAGLNGIMTQLTNGVRNEDTGAIVRGADAIQYLRDKFDSATGTAEKFRQQMADTFEGQRKMLGGSLQTFAIIAGEPFAAVFKPIITTIIDIVNAILGVFQKLPGPVKRAFASFAVGAGTVVALVGAVLAAKAGFMILLIAVKAAGLTLGGVLAIVLPAIVAFGLLAVAVAGFVVAFKNNVGGIGDFFRRVWSGVVLGFEALVQLFSDGGFSGAVRDELGRAENRGLKDFLISVFLWVNRIQNFLEGLAFGFSEGIGVAEPAITAFLDSIRSLGQALGLLSERDDAATASEKFREMGFSGFNVGRALASAFEFLVNVFKAVVEISEGLVHSWNAYIVPAAGVVKRAAIQLGEAFSGAMTALFGANEASTEGSTFWLTFGDVIGFVVAGIELAIAAIIAVISAVVSIVSGVLAAVVELIMGFADIFRGVVNLIEDLAEGRWRRVWVDMKLIVFGIVNGIIGIVLELVGAIAGAVDAIAGLFGKDLHWQQVLRDVRASLQSSLAEGLDVRSETQVIAAQSAPGSVSPALSPSSMPAAAALSATAPPPLNPAATTSSLPPMTINMQIDGQTMASASFAANQETAGRSFSPVASY